jgi:hypothetical protein
METTDSTQPAEVSRVVVRLPLFWAERPAVWFIQAEARPASEIRKRNFIYVISQLNHRYTAEVDIIISPPKQDPHTKLRTELLNQLREQ